MKPYKDAEIGNCKNFCVDNRHYDGTCLTRKHVRAESLRCIDTKDWIDSRLKGCAAYDCGAPHLHDPAPLLFMRSRRQERVRS